MTVDELATICISNISLRYQSRGMGDKTALTAATEDVDAFKAAVIQAERRRILDASLFQFGMGDGTYMMIRTSVLDPKETP
jgi:hypothetical protein